MSSPEKSRQSERAPAATPPPAGATFASFVLFASLAALLGMIYAAGEWWNLAGAFGFSSDGAWARAVLARNVASGGGLCFNPGVAAAGVAGVSWIACLAAFGLVTGKFLLGAKLLGVASVVVASFLCWHLVLDLLGDWRFAFLAGLLVAASPALMPDALGGSGASLTAMLVALAIHWQARGWESDGRHRAATAVALALAALSRPELVLLIPLAAADRWLVVLKHGRRGQRLRQALANSLPEAAGAVLLLVPYLIYNWRAGGPLWQQPESALRPQEALVWTQSLLHELWANDPVLLCACLLGIPVVALAAAQKRSRHPSYLMVLTPVVLVVAPGLLWPQATPANARLAAAYLSPVVAVVGSAGLFLLYREATRLNATERGRWGRWAFGLGMAVVCGGLVMWTWMGHRAAWLDHGFQVKRVSDLQGYVGRWAADHLAPDASIASREVGAIGFFSRRRMVDLGGTVSQEGRRALSRPGPPDSNLLAYLQQVQPSHLVIRPSDFPDLSRRADLLTETLTCGVEDPVTGGVTTMVLYETPWPPPSVRAARGQLE